MTEMGSSQRDLTLMKKYNALYQDEWHEAFVIARRIRRGKKYYEYFVHYLDLEPRVDQWLTSDCIREIQTARRMRNQQQRRTRVKEEESVEYLPGIENDLPILIKYISEIRIGGYEISTWFPNPYLSGRTAESKLWICEICLRFYKTEYDFKKHKKRCDAPQFPGILVYSHDNVMIYQVDGKEYAKYCGNLCLLAKLFSDRMAVLCYVTRFYFYVLFHRDENGTHFTGYFSKEKRAKTSYNINNILILPPYHQKGYGFILISFSYRLCIKSGTVGTPQKPLSDLGIAAFRKYWSFTILNLFNDILNSEPTKDELLLSIEDISLRTGITKEDICETLDWMKFLTHWKRKKREDQRADHLDIYICLIREALAMFIPPKLLLNTDSIIWTSMK